MMWLAAVLVLSITNLAQGELIESLSIDPLNDENTAEDPIQELKTIQKEAKDDLDRFRQYRALYSNQITGDYNPKNERFPAGDIVSPLADTMERIHEIAVKLINDRIDTLEKCANGLERTWNLVTRERKRGLCLKLAEKYRKDCQEIMIKRNSDFYEESKVFLDKHEIRLHQKNGDIVRDVKIALLQINQAIESDFSKKLQEFEDSYKTPLPWQVKLDCLEEASTIKENMTSEAKLFAEQIQREFQNCHLRTATNGTLFDCQIKLKERVGERVTETRRAANINFGPAFVDAKECARNYLEDNETTSFTVQESTSESKFRNAAAQLMINALRFIKS